VNGTVNDAFSRLARLTRSPGSTKRSLSLTTILLGPHPPAYSFDPASLRWMQQPNSAWTTRGTGRNTADLCASGDGSGYGDGGFKSCYGHRCPPMPRQLPRRGHPDVQAGSVLAIRLT